MIHFQSSTMWVSSFLSTICWRVCFFSIICFCPFLKRQWTVTVCVCMRVCVYVCLCVCVWVFCVLYSIGLVYKYIFVPVTFCFCYYGSLLKFQIRYCDTLSIALLLRIALAIHRCLCFHMNIKIVFSLWRVSLEGMNSSMIHWIHCKDLRECYNVPPPNTTIKKKKNVIGILIGISLNLWIVF
jgi:hypothetical protein